MFLLRAQLQKNRLRSTPQATVDKETSEGRSRKRVCLDPPSDGEAMNPQRQGPPPPALITLKTKKRTRLFRIYVASMDFGNEPLTKCPYDEPNKQWRQARGGLRRRRARNRKHVPYYVLESSFDNKKQDTNAEEKHKQSFCLEKARRRTQVLIISST